MRALAFSGTLHGACGGSVFELKGQSLGQPLLNAAAEEQQREGEEKGLDQCMYNGCMCFPKIYALSHANSVRLT